MKEKIRKICTKLNDGQIAASQATEQLLDLFGVSESLTPEEKKKNAILKMTLKANSGYRSEETHKVSSDQYGRICKILYEAEL